MGKGSSFGQSVQYQTIAPKSDTPGEYDQFVIDGVNRQIDWRNVEVGQVVHIALNEDVRPPAVNSRKTRIIAPYVRNVIVSTEVCTTCAHDVDADIQTICPACIETWCWDWFVRFEKRWTNHGNDTSYNYYGCRCPECRIAHKRVALAGRGKNTDSVAVRGMNLYPSAHETDDGSVKIVRFGSE